MNKYKMEFHVPTLSNPQSGRELKETILTSEPEAEIDIDLDSQKVLIEAQASPETFKQLITASGHQIN